MIVTSHQRETMNASRYHHHDDLHGPKKSFAVILTTLMTNVWKIMQLCNATTHYYRQNGAWTTDYTINYDLTLPKQVISRSVR